MKKSAQLEYNCFKIENIKFLVSPCLKYALYNINLFHAFKDWKKSKYSDIKKLKKNPKKYEGKKIDENDAKKELDWISNKLITIEKEGNDGCDFYKVHLVKEIPKFEILKNEMAKKN